MSDTTFATPTAPRPARPKGLLFPAILIAVGVVFLLGNLGYIPPIHVVNLFRLWPLLLVVWGIELLLGRRQPWAALGLEIAVIALAVGVAAAQPAGLLAPVSVGPSEASVEREGAAKLSLHVTGGAGEYVVSGGAAKMVEARTERGEIRARTTRRGDSAEVRIDPGTERTNVLMFAPPPEGVTVRVASDIPASVRLSGGAGEFTLDMREIRVTDARIETGASKTVVILPTPSGDIPVRIGAGASSIEIEVPGGVEARVTTKGGAISINSTNPRISVASGAGETAGYAAAKDRVTVTVEAGASSITIR